MGFIDKLKEKFTGKSKSSGKKEKDKRSTEERYGIPETGFQNNPLYEADQTEDHYGVEQVNPLFEEPQNAGPAVLEGNLLNNIGGLPDVASIGVMAGGLNLDKLKKHKNFNKALEALRAYQAIMGADREITVNEVKLRRKNKGSAANGDIKIETEAISNATKEMSDFIYYAGKAVDEANGVFASRSTNVRRLAPVFVNMLVKAGEILPRLVHLESAVPAYLIKNDTQNYTFSDVINHEVMGAYSGGIARTNAIDDRGTINYTPEDIQEIVEAVRDEEDLAKAAKKRNDKTEAARMEMLIPELPVGILSQKIDEAAGDEQQQKVVRSADKMADSYIAELKQLMIALDDVAEANEFTGENERQGVHDRKAVSFRLSRYFYRVCNNKELLKSLILNGEDSVSKESGDYWDVARLYKKVDDKEKYGGKTLAEAMAIFNTEAQNSTSFAKLDDAMEEGTDYSLRGGALSISILDFKKRRVLRAPKKKDASYYSKEEQGKMNNGIYDEAAGKISQFLGFQVSAQAEAAGFMAKDKEGRETAVFGGSIMEMANGVNASNINLILNEGDRDKIREARKGDDFQTVDISKNGRLIEDIMKMNVLDYLIMHEDRNLGNFMINMNAGENESMVTAIDNDMILGNNHTRFVGGKKSVDALAGIKGRVQADWGITLQGALPMLTQGIKDKLAAINIEELNQLLIPYTDRLSRLTAVERAKELKEWAEHVPTCDLTTEEGIQEYLAVTKKQAIAGWLNRMNAEETAQYRTLPSTLIRMIADTYYDNRAKGNTALWDGDPEIIMKTIKKLGFSKDEAEALLMENYTTVSDKDEITKEKLYKSTLGKYLVKYDSLAV